MSTGEITGIADGCYSVNGEIDENENHDFTQVQRKRTKRTTRSQNKKSHTGTVFSSGSGSTSQSSPLVQPNNISNISLDPVKHDLYIQQLHKWSPVSCRSSAGQLAKARRSLPRVPPLSRLTKAWNVMEFLPLQKLCCGVA